MDDKTLAILAGSSIVLKVAYADIKVSVSTGTKGASTSSGIYDGGGGLVTDAPKSPMPT